MNCNVIYVALFTPLQHGFTLKNIPKFIDQLKKLYKKNNRHFGSGCKRKRLRGLSKTRPL